MTWYYWEGITCVGLWAAGDIGVPTEAWHLDRDERLQPPAEDMIETCVQYLRKHAKPTKTFRTRFGSYYYKHRVEDFASANGRAQYIQNGAFIEAAKREGYRIRRVSPGSPNAYFNLTTDDRGWYRKEFR